MSEWVIVVLCHLSNFSAISWREQVNFQWKWGWGPLCTKRTCLAGFTKSASYLKQQSVERHVATLGHIILIPSRPVFALSSYCWVLSREATNTNFIVFGLTWPVLEPMIYSTRGGFDCMMFEAVVLINISVVL